MIKFKKFRFKFTNKQFRNAKNKRENNNISLEKYKRVQPESKKPLSLNQKESIINLLNQNSHESTTNINIIYLNFNNN